MIDINESLQRILCEIAPVELTSNESTHRGAFFTISSTNSQAVSMDNHDFLTRFDVQIDCYADTPKHCVELAKKADAAMQENGFKRNNGQLFSNQRYVLRYTAYIDEHNNIYKEV